MGRLTLRQRLFAVAVGALLAAAQAASPRDTPATSTASAGAAVCATRG